MNAEHKEVYMHEDDSLEVLLSLQSEVVHQCVVKLPLHDIISRSKDELAKKRLVEQVEKLAEDNFAEAMEICEGKPLLPRTRPPVW